MSTLGNQGCWLHRYPVMITIKVRTLAADSVDDVTVQYSIMGMQFMQALMMRMRSKNIHVASSSRVLFSKIAHLVLPTLWHSKTFRIVLNVQLYFLPSLYPSRRMSWDVILHLIVAERNWLADYVARHLSKMSLKEWNSWALQQVPQFQHPRTSTSRTKLL